MRIRLIHTLALWLLATVGVSVLAMGGVTAWNLREGFSAYLQARDIERLDKFVELIVLRLDQAGSTEGLPEPGSLDMPSLLRELQRLDGTLVDAPPAHTGQGPPPPGARDTGRPPPPPREAPVDAFGDRVAIFAANGRQLAGPPLRAGATPLIERPVRVQGQVVALVRMRPIEPVTDANDVRFLQRQYQGIAAVATALILLALISAWWLARQWAKPLAAVQQATARIARGELNVRVPSARKDEIGDVVRNVNLMAESLQNIEGARRRWIADMSHELRTPLAALRGEIEALVDGIRPLSQDAVLSLRDDVHRLGALIDDLHLLAMSDLQGLPCHMVETDAVAVVNDALQRFARRAATAGMSIRWASTPPASLPVYWDTERIHQLLSNLLENSLRYTDPPGRVELSAERTGDTVRITINDSGPGVAAEDLLHLFEPLYRGGSARSRNTGGSGLGLAICEAIAGAHGGSIQAQSSALGGLQVTVSLPVDTQAHTS